MSAVEGTPATVEENDLWRDEFGNARVLAVRNGWVMLKRRRGNPFVASAKQMLRGDYGWHLVDSPGASKRPPPPLQAARAGEDE